MEGGWGTVDQDTYLSSDPARPHLGELRPCTWCLMWGSKNNISTEAKKSLRASETLSMDNSISPKEEPALKALWLMLKSRLSDSNVVKTWVTVVTLAPGSPAPTLSPGLPGPGWRS